MPILKPRINSSFEDKELRSNFELDLSSLSSKIPDRDTIARELKPVHDSRNRWDYLKGRYPYTCQNSWILCDCITAIFIRGIELGLSQSRIRILEEMI